jgi:glycosyltransferase involved in cell wall biosynthesis
MPKVSILLPNLNSQPYIEMRMRSILEQAFTDWELIVVDSYSDDGSWEYIQKCAKNDNRIKLYQSEVRGIYINFNKCIDLAKGEYVYFATSDDTMDPTFIKKMVNALDECPGCDLAHCKLTIIDENNNPVSRKWDDFFIVRYFGELINQKHIRLAPHDALLHFSGITAYTSLTQILIRKRLFDKIGLFLTNFGSIADYEWYMRATLIANTIHVPEYLATWRVHQNQATGNNILNRAKASGQFIKMANRAIKIAKKLNPSILSKFNLKELKYILEKEKLYYEIKEKKSKQERRMSFLKFSFINPRLVKEWYKCRKQKKNFVSQEEFLNYIKKLITKYGLSKHLIPIEGK